MNSLYLARWGRTLRHAVAFCETASRCHFLHDTTTIHCRFPYDFDTLFLSVRHYNTRHMVYNTMTHLLSVNTTTHCRLLCDTTTTRILCDTMTHFLFLYDTITHCRLSYDTDILLVSATLWHTVTFRTTLRHCCLTHDTTAHWCFLYDTTTKCHSLQDIKALSLSYYMHTVGCCMTLKHYYFLDDIVTLAFCTRHWHIVAFRTTTP